MGLVKAFYASPITPIHIWESSREQGYLSRLDAARQAKDTDGFNEARDALLTIYD
jgi:hypothetical protein